MKKTAQTPTQDQIRHMFDERRNGASTRDSLGATRHLRARVEVEAAIKSGIEGVARHGAGF